MSKKNKKKIIIDETGHGFDIYYGGELIKTALKTKKEAKKFIEENIERIKYMFDWD